MSISAMKQALKFCEDIGEVRGPYPYVNGTSIVSDSRKVLTALRQAIAEAEKQEPWVKTYCGGKPNYTAPGKQEPVAWIVDGEIKVRLDMAGKLYYSETNVYAAPPKREWVGLTKAEFVQAVEGLGDLQDCWHSIEQALKEKNCPSAD